MGNLYVPHDQSPAEVCVAPPSAAAKPLTSQSQAVGAERNDRRARQRR
jgi:hypothetical protein